MRKFRILLPVIALATVVAIALVIWSGATPPPDDGTGVVRIEGDGLLYTYHPLTDTECLFDVRQDPRCLRNLARVRAEDAARLRTALCRSMGLDDITELRDMSDPTLRRLRSLGYL